MCMRFISKECGASGAAVLDKTYISELGLCSRVMNTHDSAGAVKSCDFANEVTITMTDAFLAIDPMLAGKQMCWS